MNLGVGQNIGEGHLHVSDRVHPEVFPHFQGKIQQRQVDDHLRSFSNVGAESHRQTNHAHDHLGGFALGEKQEFYANP